MNEPMIRRKKRMLNCRHRDAFQTHTLSRMPSRDIDDFERERQQPRDQLIPFFFYLFFFFSILHVQDTPGPYFLFSRLILLLLLFFWWKVVRFLGWWWVGATRQKKRLGKERMRFRVHKGTVAKDTHKTLLLGTTESGGA